MWSLYLVQVMNRVEKNMERKNILCNPSNEKAYFYISALMKPDRFELWRLVTCQFKYVVDPRFSFCVLKMSESLCFCWLFPLLLNSYINVKYPVRQKLTRLITQAQSYALRVLYDTYNLRLFCFLGTTDQTSSAFVRKLSQVNEKPMIIIIISVCSQIITYKAVKANSWL